nr:DUF1176 domain-containing protein [Paracoccus saliphilus]
MVPAPEGEQPVTIFESTCDAGAYNLVQAFLIHTDRDGLRPLSFAVPVVQIPDEHSRDHDQGFPATPGAALAITGYGTTMTLINPSVDEATGQIATMEKWRGLGDAGASGVWDLTATGYVLRRYMIDATYNGRIDPVTVLDLPGPVAAE